MIHTVPLSRELLIKSRGIRHHGFRVAEHQRNQAIDNRTRTFLERTENEAFRTSEALVATGLDRVFIQGPRLTKSV